MELNVLWTPWSIPGLEHLRLKLGEDGVEADSLLIGLEENETPFRVRYTLRCDSSWRVQELHVTMLDTAQPELHILSNGSGHWTTGDGSALPLLDGCLDVDLAVTPFTNTLPIRRLSWRKGEAVDIVVAYVSFPTLLLTAEPQRYTCLEQREKFARFLFEAPQDNFVAELAVDSDGLVLDYPGLFRRVWPSS